MEPHSTSLNPSSDTLDVNPPVLEVKNITLDNLFNSANTRLLACQPGDIAGLTVGEYTITKIVSQNGGHGLVVVCVDNSGVKWAMKIERENQKMTGDNLAMTEMSNHAANLSEKNLHISRLQKGFNEGAKEITVMDLLGPDVYSLQKALGSHHDISMKSIIQVGISLLHSLEEIHRAGWLHLSTKPVNICIGGTPETRHKVYYVDFGRAEKYRTACGTHRPLEMAKRAGHEQYNSVWHNYSITASRRDDIMSLGLLLKDLEGYEKLPWECNGYSSLHEWLIYLEAWRYHRNLKPYKKLVLEASKMWYDDEPKYAELRKYFEDYAKDHGIVLDGKYDWDHLLHEDDGRMVLLRKE